MINTFSAFVFIDSLVVSMHYRTRVAMRLPTKITLSCIWVAIPVDWVILHWYACGADWRAFGRCAGEGVRPYKIEDQYFFFKFLSKVDQSTERLERVIFQKYESKKPRITAILECRAQQGENKPYYNSPWRFSHQYNQTLYAKNYGANAPRKKFKYPRTLI